MSLVFLVMCPAQGVTRDSQVHGRWQWRMTFGHVSKATALKARLLCCCKNQSLGAWRRWREGLSQKILGNSPPYPPDMKHSFLPDALASGPNISSDLHSPSGVIHHIAPFLPVPSNGNPGMWPFYWGHVGWMWICFSNSDIGKAWATGSALEETGSMA